MLSIKAAPVQSSTEASHMASGLALAPIYTQTGIIIKEPG